MNQPLHQEDNDEDENTEEEEEGSTEEDGSSEGDESTEDEESVAVGNQNMIQEGADGDESTNEEDGDEESVIGGNHHNIIPEEPDHSEEFGYGGVGQANDYDDDSSCSGHDEDVVGRLLSSHYPHQDETMKLTEQERTWALAIKQVVETESEELKPLTDMEYAVYAIISKDDLKDAKRRIQGIQTFREVYQLDDSPQQGVHYIEGHLNQQPRVLLCIDVDADTLRGLTVMNGAAFNFDVAMANDTNWRTFVCGAYYLYYACQPTLQSVREGHCIMTDFTGFEFETKHVNAEFQARYAGEMFAYFPIRFAKYLAFNTGFPATIAMAMLKRVFPPSFMEVMELGLQIPVEEGEVVPSSLEEKYLQPSLFDANNRMLSRALDLLTLRAKNQALFQL